jgi:hypothetical protein
VTRLVFVALLTSAAAQPPAAAAAAQVPGNASPGAPTERPAPPDPAAVTFSTDAGLLLVAVKPDKITDYEAAVVALQEALAAASDEQTRLVAAGWRVFKATGLDATANALYVHWLEPTVPGADYRPSLWLDQLLAGAPPELLAKYRDAFAAPPTKLPLVEFADMAVTPVRPPSEPADPPPPGNVSPAGPRKPPGDLVPWKRDDSQNSGRVIPPR